MTNRIWLILIAILVIAIFAPIAYWHFSSTAKTSPNLYFGVSFGGNTTAEAERLIDKVKGYTNFFLIDSYPLSINETALNQVCNYAAQADLSFMVYFDFIQLHPDSPEYSWHGNWVTTASDKWPNHFKGIYIYDEPGGKQIDTGMYAEFDPNSEVAQLFENAKNDTNNSEAAQIFLTYLPRGWSFHYLENSNISRFTSDYALYWFDYLAGYDTIFVELGWNNSRPQQIGLCRGAANVQGKEWGAILTWTYENPPYLANGTEILEDMLTAYEAGAKYIILFDYPTYPENNPYGILQKDHFTAMQQFWTHIHQYPEDFGKTKGQVAFVLPKDYGWGMRQPDDSIWGLWTDNMSSTIWDKMNKLTEKYGLQLDIVYDDPQFSLNGYSEVYYWNSSID
jgi:hypothetical protein